MLNGGSPVPVFKPGVEPLVVVRVIVGLAVDLAAARVLDGQDVTLVVKLELEALSNCRLSCEEKVRVL